MPYFTQPDYLLVLNPSTSPHEFEISLEGVLNKHSKFQYKYQVLGNTYTSSAYLAMCPWSIPLSSYQLLPSPRSVLLAAQLHVNGVYKVFTDDMRKMLFALGTSGKVCEVFHD